MMFATSFKRNLVRQAFKSLILGVVILLTPFFVYGLEEGIFNDNFDTYNLGILVGQGGWWDFTGINWQVVGDKYHSEPKSAFCDRTTYCDIKKEGEGNRLLGIHSHYFYLTDDFTIGYPVFSFVSMTSEYENSGNYSNFNSFGFLYNTITTKWDFVDFTEETPIIIISDVSLNAWHYVEAEFDVVNWKYKLRLDSGYWSDWLNFKTGLDPAKYTGIDGLNLRSSSISNFLDTINGEIESCVLGLCSNCETYDSCIGAGCFWEYSLYMCQIGMCYYCAEPYEPEPEQCDAFYKCQYCMTQETCEIQLNCEWVDRGLGLKCYMIEPQIPPEQVEWEIPELEDCSLLLGVEKWLCEIKNFVAGIFMPSQDKIDTLYQTFANFKERFPFNYIGSMNFFFSDVRNSLDVEKNIPVKILGQESNVSFSFWDKTTTIGGVSEPLKNILKDFTSFIVFLGFFLWLISFIQRFF